MLKFFFAIVCAMYLAFIIYSKILNIHLKHTRQTLYLQFALNVVVGVVQRYHTRAATDPCVLTLRTLRLHVAI
jgi:hypothetical protein